MPKPPNHLDSFSSLIQIIATLRGPKGCPWDKKQNHKSLVQYAIEETFELAEAIETKQRNDIKEELGDLLLQVVLHAQIACEKSHFTINDVIRSINEKLIRRHPHVFAHVKVKNAQEVTHNWEQIKKQEKPNHLTKPFNIPNNLPSLQRAQKIGQKTEKIDFDWPNVKCVLEKVEEEFLELKNALAHESRKKQQEELGDLLFSLAQLGRHLNLDTEQTLRYSNRKFENRFQKMLNLCSQKKRRFEDLSRQEKEQLWNQIKTKN